MQINLDTPQDTQRAIEALLSVDVGKGYVCIIKKPKVPKSCAQNRLLWMWLTCLEKESETGYTKEDFYHMFTNRFPVFHTVMMDCAMVTSSHYTKEEFTRFLENVKSWSLEELGVDLPDPEDVKWEVFYKKYGL